MQVLDPSAVAIVGLARRDITPPAGIYNRAWGAARHDTAEGVHRPLTATAIAVRPMASPGAEHETLVLVAMDAGWWQTLSEERYIRGAVLERFGLDASRVMIALSHTHSGPSITRRDADQPGGELIAGYLEQMRGRVLDAVEEAIRNARPATLAWTHGRCGLAANRDLPEPDVAKPSRVVCGFNPDSPADDTLLVGRITDNSTGRIIGTLVNYACHPTTLAWENRLISPDYVGAMRELVEAHTGGAPCAFLQGCSGELAPREQYTGDVTIADRNGRQLGYAVLSALEGMLPPQTSLSFAGVVESGAPLATWARVPYAPPAVLAARLIEVPLPLKPMPSEEQIESQVAAGADRVMAERLRRKLRVRRSVGAGPVCTQPAWIWRVGDALLIGQPNEAYSALQIALRRRFPGHAVAVMNLVNGTIGYLSPAELHDQDIYQVWQSPFDRNSLAVLVDACEQAVKGILGT